MMRSGNGLAVAAIFGNEAAAREAMTQLEERGFRNPWLAIVETSHDTDVAQAETSDRHAVADASDGVLGSIGRFVSGDGSLRRSLVDHGVIENVALEIDRTVEHGNAVVVISSANVASPSDILQRLGGDVFGAGETEAPDVSRDQISVPGQADDLDRGTGRAHSGGGLGSTTGFTSDRAARRDLGNELVDAVEDPDRDRDAADERRSQTHI